MSFCEDFPRSSPELNGQPPVRRHGGQTHRYVPLLPRRKRKPNVGVVSPHSVNDFVTEVMPLFTPQDWKIYEISLQRMFAKALKADLLDIEGEPSSRLSSEFLQSLELEHLALISPS